MILLAKLLVKKLLKPNKSNKIRFVNYIFRFFFGLNKEFPFSVHYTSIITNPENIIIEGGAQTFKSFENSGGCYFSAQNGIIIERDVLFAPGLKVISANHDFTHARNPLPSNPIIIGANTWLGTNVVVLPGVCIGKHAVIGAAAVVKNNVPAHAIVVGVPAKVVGYTCDCGSHFSLKKSLPWDCECGVKLNIEDGNLKIV